MHYTMLRAGWMIGRDQVARLMRRAGLAGAVRGKKTFTTVSDPAGARPADLVQRRFKANGPSQLWVADISYIPTWSGFAYAAFVTDVFSRGIVGWAVSGSLSTKALPLQALNMAALMKDTGNGLIHHSDRGTQGGFNWSSQHLNHGGVDGQARRLDDGVDGALAHEVAGCAGA